MLVETIQRIFERRFYQIRTATTADEVRLALTDWGPHAAIADMDLNGGYLLDLILSQPGGSRLPVVGLTRTSDLETRLNAFDAGVDDVLTIPFQPRELLARAMAVLRRSYSDALNFSPVITVHELEIDIVNRRVRLASSDLKLTPLQESLLYLLAANAGRVVTREEILDTLWGADYVPESNVVDRQVRNLRARLQDTPHNPRYIATVQGRGYRFLLAGRAGTEEPDKSM